VLICTAHRHINRAVWSIPNLLDLISTTCHNPSPRHISENVLRFCFPQGFHCGNAERGQNWTGKRCRLQLHLNTYLRRLVPHVDLTGVGLL
jgi:hypothetical protein